MFWKHRMDWRLKGHWSKFEKHWLFERWRRGTRIQLKLKLRKKKKIAKRAMKLLCICFFFLSNSEFYFIFLPLCINKLSSKMYQIFIDSFFFFITFSSWFNFILVWKKKSSSLCHCIGSDWLAVTKTKWFFLLFLKIQTIIAWILSLIILNCVSFIDGCCLYYSCYQL